MVRRMMTLLLVLAAALLLAACGSDDKKGDSGSSDSGSTGASAPADEGSVVNLTADGTNLAFKEKNLEVKAGTVTLKLKNDSSIPHDIAIKDGDKQVGDAGELVTGGDVSQTTVELEAGKTYTFYCEPHEGAGMTGELKVT